MQRFIKVDTLEYPIYESDLRYRLKNVSFGAFIRESDVINLGYMLVHSTTPPAEGVVSEGAPQQIDGKYYQTWTTRSYNNQELAEQINRNRDALIAAGVEHTFPDGTVDRVQVFDRDLTILTKIESNARLYQDVEGYIQPFRTMSNRTYMLTAEQVIDMTTAVFLGLHRIYEESWAAKDALN